MKLEPPTAVIKGCFKHFLERAKATVSLPEANYPVEVKRAAREPPEVSVVDRVEEGLRVKSLALGELRHLDFAERCYEGGKRPLRRRRRFLFRPLAKDS